MVERETARDLAGRLGRSVHTVRAWARHDDFPDPAEIGPRNTHLYDPGQVDRWLEAHPAVAGPPPVTVDGDPDETLTLSQFANRIGKARGTVYQYDTRPPEAADGRYRLADLTAWWTNRPGQGARTDLA